MSLYLYLALYVVGFIVMFALLVHADRILDMEFDLLDTVRTSFLWPFYAIAIVGIEIYEFFKRKKSR